ncbi:MAG: ABC transporter permease [Telmatospirillum sp.]|nr:ABC transporter permease [Telmatospirillum sp.]
MSSRFVRRAIGAACVGAVVLLAILGPWLIEADPLRQNLRAALRPPFGDDLLGTDHLGRSVLARLAHAARLSVSFGAASAASAALLGTGLGLVAALRGGIVDRVAGALCDATMALPGLLLVLILAAFAPGAFWPLYLGIALALWVEFFRLVRTVARSRLMAPEVEAARLFGFGDLHIVKRHLLPHLLPALGALFAFGFGASVAAVSTLSFIGVGLRPPTPEWGNMMTELLPYYDEAPIQLLAPAGLLFATVLGLQLLAGRDTK